MLDLIIITLIDKIDKDETTGTKLDMNSNYDKYHGSRCKALFAGAGFFEGRQVELFCMG